MKIDDYLLTIDLVENGLPKERLPFNNSNFKYAWEYVRKNRSRLMYILNSVDDIVRVRHNSDSKCHIIEYINYDKAKEVCSTCPYYNDLLENIRKSSA